VGKPRRHTLQYHAVVDKGAADVGGEGWGIYPPYSMGGPPDNDNAEGRESPSWPLSHTDVLISQYTLHLKIYIFFDEFAWHWATAI
jgi:hypothetical protein